VVLKRGALFRGQRLAFGTVHMPHQIAFAIARHTVAENMLLHPATNVYRVNLDETVMRQDGGNVRHTCIEQERATMKTTGHLWRDFDWGGQHFWSHRIANDC
jgi:hypothetical protein